MQVALALVVAPLGGGSYQNRTTGNRMLGGGFLHMKLAVALMDDLAVVHNPWNDSLQND